MDHYHDDNVPHNLRAAEHTSVLDVPEVSCDHCVPSLSYIDADWRMDKNARVY